MTLREFCTEYTLAARRLPSPHKEVFRKKIQKLKKEKRYGVIDKLVRRVISQTDPKRTTFYGKTVYLHYHPNTVESAVESTVLKLVTGVKGRNRIRYCESCRHGRTDTYNRSGTIHQPKIDGGVVWVLFINKVHEYVFCDSCIRRHYHNTVITNFVGGGGGGN